MKVDVPKEKELLHFPLFPMVLLLDQSVPLLHFYYLEFIITNESHLRHKKIDQLIGRFFNLLPFS